MVTNVLPEISDQLCECRWYIKLYENLKLTNTFNNVGLVGDSDKRCLGGKIKSNLKADCDELRKKERKQNEVS